MLYCKISSFVHTVDSKGFVHAAMLNVVFMLETVYVPINSYVIEFSSYYKLHWQYYRTIRRPLNDKSNIRKDNIPYLNHVHP